MRASSVPLLATFNSDVAHERVGIVAVVLSLVTWYAGDGVVVVVGDVVRGGWRRCW